MQPSSYEPPQNYGDLEAVAGVDFEIPFGECFALLSLTAPARRP